MSQIKHTPGPWTHGPAFTLRGQASGIRAADDTHVAAVLIRSGENKIAAWYEAHSNARLIASAPALLDALRDMLAMSGGSDGTSSAGLHLDPRLVRAAAVAAITQATGEAPK